MGFFSKGNPPFQNPAYGPDSCPPAGAQVPITSYVCTQSNFYHTLTDSSLCNVSSGLWTCETKGEACPTLVTRVEMMDYIYGPILTPL